MKKYIRTVWLLSLIWLGIIPSIQADPAADIAKLREAYAATNRADFIAVGDNKQGTGKVIRYQWRDPVDDFVFRRLDFIYLGRSDFMNPDAVDQSNRWNRNGFFIVTGRNAVRQSSPGMDWLPKYDFDWIRKISARNLDYSGLPCIELRAEVQLPGSRLTVVYRLNRNRPFIHAYEIFNEQNESVEQFDFGTVDFNPQLTAADFDLPAKAKEQPVNLSPALQKLQRAMSRSQAVPFTALLEEDAGLKTKRYYRVYQLPLSEYEPPLLRIDRMDDSKSSAVQFSRLSNRQGLFWIFGSDAVKNRFTRFDVPPYLGLAVTPGITVTERKLSDGNLEYILRFPADFPFPPEIDRKERMSLRRYYVRQNDEFIYAWEYFNSSGSRIAGYSFSDVQFEPEFPSGIFDFPKRAKIHEADKLEEIREKFYREILASSAPNWFQRQYVSIRQFCGRNTGSILAWGGKISFWLAIVTVAVVVALKIRARRLNSR